ncbi:MULTISPECIES: T9SS type A sorting domain-containing protein [Chryseobacterium]|uniref:Secretion system C-terminal sorting domain-containing protein n=1 Tax=Chryseobacterium camelliae TaxID=1265445 RepID=A0ABU0TKQ6_9FLAO|nr:MULTISPECIES: T9SS type A sorting domain-containing protein [Chryseobacterium]MDT3408517.1 hypothetical protein [Pseudacidovorax intermedius]MDQ1097628.1 hypothetical protein [Chryseobacterium camelliae]MDQ1101557.1 hypothetical protein [Chryseobacterium sp. SORGH_AS_1048]MDR6085000.1 hypothetical protein [Chryseobacterium sp. SORGH_AS_0909]MDR6129354.1 hypothetical protein [Chryseobacterium sp. SORGH_AS_1175]
MKKTLLTVLAACGLCTAQTTITKAFNDPVTGDVVNNVNVNGTVNNSATGSNATFSNGSLTAGSASPSTYSAPTASEISSYPGTTIKMVNGTTTAYFKASASKLEITALVTPDATLNFSANNGTYISYPAAYGYAETDTAQGTFTASGASGNFSGTINISADASGTLIIGNKTYTNVLRIKSVQNFNLTSSGFPLGTVSNTSYMYYDATHKFPLLSSTTANINISLLNINQTTNTAQALNETFLAVLDQHFNKERLSIYPNPAQDAVQIRGNTAAFSSARIYSLDGKILKTSALNSGTIDVSELPSATYFIEFTGKETKEAHKLIKK